MPKRREKFVLKTIPKPKPKTRVVLEPKPEICPVVVGKGNLDLLCGKCKRILVKSIDWGQIQNIVIRCPKCGAYNDILFTLESMKPKFPKRRVRRREKR